MLTSNRVHNSQTCLLTTPPKYLDFNAVNIATRSWAEYNIIRKTLLCIGWPTNSEMNKKKVQFSVFSSGGL